MRYVIAGGGQFGAHYCSKILAAASSGRIAPAEIIVVDQDKSCRASSFPDPCVDIRIEPQSWRAFGAGIWLDRSCWLDDIWVPAPIAPHILSEWVVDRVREVTGASLTPIPIEAALPDLPFAVRHSDHRLLLSHAPGLCPVDCIEPAICAITKDTRWWEMSDTIERWLKTECGPQISATAMFFCKHHCAEGQNDIGGVPFATIFEQADKLIDHVRQGASTVAVATFSSCHGVITPLEVVGGESLAATRTRKSAFATGPVSPLASGELTG